MRIGDPIFTILYNMETSLNFDLNRSQENCFKQVDLFSSKEVFWLP